MRMFDLQGRRNYRMLAQARISALGWDDLPKRKYRAITWEFMRQQRLAARMWVELFEGGTQNYKGVEYTAITFDELCADREDADEGVLCVDREEQK